MYTVEFLKAAKEVIGTPEKWTKGSLARSPEGWDVGTNDSTAVCFCSLGALEATHNKFAKTDYVTANKGYSDAHFALRLAVSEVRTGGLYAVVGFNDNPHTTHEDVMKVWDRAIEIAAEKEGVK